MHKFKVGDRIKRVHGGDDARYDMCRGNVYTFRRDDGSNINVSENSGSWDPCNFELVTNSNKTIMSSLKEKFVSAFLTEPEKTYRKVGITNGDGVITPEGQELFLTWLLKQNPTFKTEVVDIIAAEQEKAVA